MTVEYYTDLKGRACSLQHYLINDEDSYFMLIPDTPNNIGNYKEFANTTIRIDFFKLSKHDSRCTVHILEQRTCIPTYTFLITSVRDLFPDEFL